MRSPHISFEEFVVQNLQDFAMAHREGAVGKFRLMSVDGDLGCEENARLFAAFRRSKKDFHPTVCYNSVNGTRPAKLICQCRTIPSCNSNITRAEVGIEVDKNLAELKLLFSRYY